MLNKCTKIKVEEHVCDDAIDLSLLNLSVVPVRDIAKYQKATILDLSNNNLIKLSKDFTTLLHLTSLDLSKNNLSTLPENFGLLKRLIKLDLYENNLVCLPNSFGNLINLRWLDIKRNPLETSLCNAAGSCSNAEDCRSCAKNVVGFYSRVLALESEMQRKKADSERKMAKELRRKAWIDVQEKRKIEREQRDRERDDRLKSRKVKREENKVTKERTPLKSNKANIRKENRYYFFILALILFAVISLTFYVMNERMWYELVDYLRVALQTFNVFMTHLLNYPLANLNRFGNGLVKHFCAFNLTANLCTYLE